MTAALNTAGWQQEGLLHKLGYKVGNNGLRESDRRAVLRNVFKYQIPVREQKNPYNAQWGNPESPERLRKMATTIAQLCINMKKKKNQDTDAAVAHYEADLKWLRDTYYKLTFDFVWPHTDA